MDKQSKRYVIDRFVCLDPMQPHKGGWLNTRIALRATKASNAIKQAQKLFPGGASLSVRLITQR